jgi:hypothetical protein
MSNPLSDALAEVLRDYVRARLHDRIGHASLIWKRVMAIPALLTATPVVHARPRVTVRASAGQGGWARIPWVALLDSAATNTTRDGLYVIYLFCEDMSGVFLTLNQGVTEPTRRLGTAVGLASLRQRARDFRPRLADLASRGFELDRPLDLRSSFSLAQQYVASTIAHRFYSAASLSDDPDLLSDLDHALRAYEGLITAPE